MADGRRRTTEDGSQTPDGQAQRADGGRQTAEDGSVPSALSFSGSIPPSAISPLPSGSTPPSAISPLPSAVCRPASLLSAFEHEVVEVFVGLAKVLGLPKSYGEIYGLLFASAQPLSFADIQEKLDLSKGSVSQGLRALRDLGAVRIAATAIGGPTADGGRRTTESGGRITDGRGQTAEGRNRIPGNPPSAALDSRSSVPNPPSGSSQPPDIGHPPSAICRPSSGSTPPSALRPLPSGSASPTPSPSRDYYVPVLELRRLMSAFLQASIDPQLAQSRANLTRAGELLPADRGLPEAQRDLLFRRLEKLQTWHQRAQGLLPWAVRFLG